MDDERRLPGSDRRKTSLTTDTTRRRGDAVPASPSLKPETIVNGSFREIATDDLRTVRRVLTLITERVDEALAGFLTPPGQPVTHVRD
jgi:hypothetical protein